MPFFGNFSPKHEQFKLKCDACNPGQIILNKIEKFSIIGQEKKSLISNFACFLSAIAKV